MLKEFKIKIQTNKHTYTSLIPTTALIASCGWFEKFKKMFDTECKPFMETVLVSMFSLSQNNQKNSFDHCSIALFSEERPQCYCVIAKSEDNRYLKAEAWRNVPVLSVFLKDRSTFSSSFLGGYISSLSNTKSLQSLNILSYICLGAESAMLARL